MPNILYLVRRGYALSPASAADGEKLEELPRGKIIRVIVEDKVSPKLPRLYFAMLQKLVKAGAEWPTVDMAHFDMRCRCGFKDSVYISSDGDKHTFRFTAQSTKGWGADTWRTYFMLAYDVVLREILPKYPSPTLRAEIEKFAGITFKEAMEEEADGGKAEEQGTALRSTERS